MKPARDESPKEAWGEPGQPLHWEESTSHELAQHLARVPMAIWCFGSVEQHGPHLPLGGDTLEVAEVGRRVSALTEVVLLPTMMFGSSQLHGRRFPGTLSIRPQTLILIVEDVAQWLYENGVRKLLLLNGHGGDYAPLVCAMNDLQHDLPDDFQIKTFTWSDVPEVAQLLVRDVPQGEKYVHAGWSVTSLILAIRPDLVQMDRAVDEPGLDTQFDYRIDQVSNSGVVGGEVTRASREDGELMLERATQALVDMVKEMLAEATPIVKNSEGRGRSRAME